MAARETEQSVGEHLGHDHSLTGGRMPITPPELQDNLAPAPSVSEKPEELKISTDGIEHDADRTYQAVDWAISTEDGMKTPKSEQPSLVNTPAASDLSVPAQTGLWSPVERRVEHHSPGYFGHQLHQAPSMTNSSQPTSSSSLSSLASHPSSTPLSHESRTSSWREIATQTVIGPSYHPDSARPTSVPNFQSQSSSQSRNATSDPPVYPNQAFAALHSQHHPPPYQGHQLRTRSSHTSQGSYSGGSDGKPLKDFPRMSSGAKTVGNTPAQSPGLFSPLFSKRGASDSDDGHYTASTLHSAHLQEPKETHKLLKDIDPVSGRKLVNNYEFVKKLGSGQHGTVKLGINLHSGDNVAVKIVRRFSKKLRLGRQGDPNDMIKKEVAILKKARHQNVVSLFEVIDDDEFEKVYLILEYVERGEIIWRKQTDRAIATFELERLRREATGHVDEAFEIAAIERFNSEIPARRSEKAQRLEDQKRQAREELAARRPGMQQFGASHYWSLEYGGESEYDYDVRDDPAIRYDDERMSRADVHAVETAYTSPQSATPVYTSRSRPESSHTNQLSVSQPASRPTSRPDSPQALDGSVYGAYSESGGISANASDLALQSMLSQIVARQLEEWSQDEEDFRYVPCLTLAQALDAFRDTVLGLEYLHYQGIIHRDIKPANLLWTNDYRVKISDFGVSYLGKPIREDDNHEEIAEADAAILDEAIELAKTVGTPAFYAPELCDPAYFEAGKNSKRPAITGQIDVWALGVTLYGMVFGRLPFFHPNEFQMYEKIAHAEVVIPRFRLKGVEHTDKTPSNHNKRLEDVLEYEEVDDTLCDLLRRLLAKDPLQRISLKEVKHHPWVISGIEDQTAWLDDTDPSRQSQGKKIEVSNEEVADAVVGLTFVDQLKKGVQRLSSVLRGRGSRKRAESNAKVSDSFGPTGTLRAREARRTSLRGDEQIYTALRASREGSEHPLAQSVAASPEIKDEPTYFANDSNPLPPPPSTNISHVHRPSLTDRTLSTADSMKTIRAPLPPIARDTNLAPPSWQTPEAFSSTLTTIVDPLTPSHPSFGGIFGGAGRRAAESPTRSSRASSIDPNTEELHASPSLAISSAVAEGHVDQPLALHEEAAKQLLLHDSSNESIPQVENKHSRQRSVGFARSRSHRSSSSRVIDPMRRFSLSDAVIASEQRPHSAADSTSTFAVSSSSDQIVSGVSTAHSRIPSVVSGASSLSNTVEEEGNQTSPSSEKQIPAVNNLRRSGSRPRSAPAADESLNPKPALAKAAAEEEAGYNGEGDGEGEQDSDSDDEGLAMA